MPKRQICHSHSHGCDQFHSQSACADQGTLTKDLPKTSDACDALPWPASGASFQLCRCHFCHFSMFRTGAKWINVNQNKLFRISSNTLEVHGMCNSRKSGCYCEHKPSARVHSKLRRGKAFVVPKVSAWRKAPTRPQLFKGSAGNHESYE